MDLSALQAECGRLLGDPSNTRWSTSVLTLRLNLAQTEVQGYTNAVKTKETLTPVAATATVSLDAKVIDVIRVDIKRTDASWVPLRGYLRDALDFEFPNWQQLTNGQPLAYWWDGTTQQLNLVPAPDSANAIASGLRVWEIQRQTDLASAADVPFASNNAMIPYHLALVHWTVAQCFLDDGTAESLAKARFHRSGDIQRPGEFEKEIKRILSKFDAPESIPARILWRPQGARTSDSGNASKANPLGQ